MRALVFAVGAVAFVGCLVEPHPVKLTFGSNSQGLDGFLCKDTQGKYTLDRLQPAYADGGTYGPDAGLAHASLVTDFVQVGNFQSCRTSELIENCKTPKKCSPVQSTRVCTDIQLPYGVTGMMREDVRALVAEQLKALKGHQVASDAPDGFVMLRALATAQTCGEVMPLASGELPVLDKTKLVGCAYSCPLLFDQLNQDVYLGFDTLTATCEQGLKTCADNDLKWSP